MFSAKNEHIRVDGADIDYIVFGTGTRDLILLPGVGDGFKTVKGMALPFSVMFRQLGRRYRVYVFSRRNDLPEGYTTGDMADDVARTMSSLGRGAADVIGVSQGGMIAQELAVRHPEQVDRLVLTVTAARPNPLMTENLNRWLAWSEQRDYRSIMLDTAQRSYTGSYLKWNLPVYRLLTAVSRPKDYTRFQILCRSCLTHNTFDRLGQISCPTLIVGGGKDDILGAEASRELAGQIRNGELIIYEEYSHGLYEQAKDYYDRVLNWLNRNR